MTGKTLVIGGCGFLGSALVDQLLRRGAVVRVLDTRPHRCCIYLQRLLVHSCQGRA